MYVPCSTVLILRFPWDSGVQGFPCTHRPLDWAEEESVYGHSIVNTLENAEMFGQFTANRPARCGCVPHMMRRSASVYTRPKHESRSVRGGIGIEGRQRCKQVSWAQVAFLKIEIPRSWLNVDDDRPSPSQFALQRVPTDMPAWLPTTSPISLEWLGEDTKRQGKADDASRTMLPERRASVDRCDVDVSSKSEFELTDTSTTPSDYQNYHAPSLGPHTYLRSGLGDMGEHPPLPLLTQLSSSPDTSSNCHSLDTTLVAKSRQRTASGQFISRSPPRVRALDKISCASVSAKMELECRGDTVTRDFFSSPRECVRMRGQGGGEGGAYEIGSLLSMCDILTNGMYYDVDSKKEHFDHEQTSIMIIDHDCGTDFPQGNPQAGVTVTDIGNDPDDICDLLTFGGSLPSLEGEGLNSELYRHATHSVFIN